MIALREASRQCSADERAISLSSAGVPGRVYEPVCVVVSSLKEKAVLCQNCVTYPPKPWGNTVTYGDTLKQIVVVNRTGIAGERIM